MKFCDERIQKHLLNGGKIKRVSESRNIDYRPIKFIDDMLCFADKPNEYYVLSKNNLNTDDWEIIETKYNWDKIIKNKILCVFSDDKNFKDEIISILTKIDDDYYYTTNGLWFKYCKPFNQKEFNIVNDIMEYEK